MRLLFNALQLSSARTIPGWAGTSNRKVCGIGIRLITVVRIFDLTKRIQVSYDAGIMRQAAELFFSVLSEAIGFERR
jgi:hypothetical protein